jgi:hypothetical protein
MMIHIRRKTMNLLDFYVSVKEETELDTVMTKLRKVVADELLNSNPTSSVASSKKRSVAKEVVGEVSEEDKKAKKAAYAKRQIVALKHIKQMEDDGAEMSADDKRKVKQHYHSNDLYEIDEDFTL